MPLKSKFRLQTKIALIAVLIVGGAFVTSILRGCAAGTREAQQDYFRKLLSIDDRIQSVSIGGYDEEFGQFDVTTVRFTIAEKPHSAVVLFVPNGAKDLSPLRVYQIGNLSPVLLEWDAKAFQWAPRCPAVGDDSRYRPPLPWSQLTISDLVSRYDEVVEYFGKWPVYPEFGTFSTEQGELRYYIEPPNVNTKSSFIPGIAAGQD